MIQIILAALAGANGLIAILEFIKGNHGEAVAYTLLASGGLYAAATT